MRDNHITIGAIVRLRVDTPAVIAGVRFVGIVQQIDGGRASVVRGAPGEEIGAWIPLYDLEVVPWEELAGVEMVLIA